MKQVFTLLLSLLSITSFAQNWDEMIKAVALDRTASDNFGYTVSIDGNRAAVTASLDDEDASGGNPLIDAGSVYIFELSGGLWVQTAKLVASDREADDRFGCRISLSGDRIIIGAYLEDEDQSGGATMNEAGSAYIFELIGGVWTETAKLVASDRASGSRFGFDVAISGDRVIVGAYYNATDTTSSTSSSLVSAGAAYTFELIGGVWTQTAKLVASDRAIYSYFGYSVSMEGTTAIIGSQGNKTDANGANSMSNAGAAYVFELIGGVWIQTAKLVASDRGTNDNFGFSNKISNNKLVIGAYKDGEDVQGGNTLTEAGSAYIFELIGGVWTETAKLVASDRGLNDQFGYNVDIDNDKVIIGARYEDEDNSGANYMSNSGAAYVYELIGGVWTETTKLVTSDRGADDQFGTSVGVSGNMILVGAFMEDEDSNGGNTLIDAGSVYIFNTCVNPSVIASGNSLIADVAGATYQWLDCNNGQAIISGETNQTFTTNTSGNYAVEVTLGNCIDTSACTSLNVGLNDVISTGNIKLYPNPTKENITIDVSKLENPTITIINNLGVEVYKSVIVTQNKLEVSLAEFSNGIYFVRIQSGNEFYTQKVIKQ